MADQIDDLVKQNDKDIVSIARKADHNNNPLKRRRLALIYTPQEEKDEKEEDLHTYNNFFVKKLRKNEATLKEALAALQEKLGMNMAPLASVLV